MFDKLIDRLAALMIKNARIARAVRRAQIMREIETVNGQLAVNRAAVAGEEAQGNFEYFLGYERVNAQEAKLNDLIHEYACI